MAHHSMNKHTHIQRIKLSVYVEVFVGASCLRHLEKSVRLLHVTHNSQRIFLKICALLFKRFSELFCWLLHVTFESVIASCWCHKKWQQLFHLLYLCFMCCSGNKRGPDLLIETLFWNSKATLQWPKMHRVYFVTERSRQSLVVFVSHLSRIQLFLVSKNRHNPQHF